MIKLKSEQFVCINYVELCFAWFCYQLFWFFCFLNLTGLSDGKVVSFTKNEHGSLVQPL